MGTTVMLTADDLHEINRELAKGNDVEIRRTPEGLAIKAHTVRTVKKKRGTAQVGFTTSQSARSADSSPW
nr:MAG TPA: hypothetical protein [Caudoviricetes sp.]